MKGTYRSYRFEIIPNVDYTTNVDGDFIVASVGWRYRISSPSNVSVFDTNNATPPVFAATFEDALNFTIVRINAEVASGEQVPIQDTPGNFI